MKPVLTLPLLLAAGLAAGTAPAQAQAPRVSLVFPPVVQRGAGGTVTLTGEYLKPGSRVLVSGEGVTGTAAAEGGGESLSVRLQVAVDAVPGVRELRVLGPNGASNAARVVVGRLPTVAEVEPRERSAEVQALKELPVTVYGRIEALGDEDLFRFRVGAGETWVFELGSASHGSRLDGFVQLRDSEGRDLATVMETLDRDPRLIHTFKAAGDYTLSVRDVTYKGGPESTYWLSIGKLPTVTRVLPLGVTRGQTTTVQLAGVNLGGMGTLDVTVPAEYPGDTMVVVLKTPAGEAAPLRLAVAATPEAVEAEPNNDRPHATRFSTLPAAVSGVIGQNGDVDLYAFRAEAGQKLLIDLSARRLGTRLDSFLRVLDRTGKELANNDDGAGKDSRLSWSPPAAGDYFIEVRDLAGQGGDAYGYRLELTATPAPDFRLTVSPDVVNFGQGGSEVLTVRAERLNEFAGEVAVRVEGLPAGVTASPGAIRPGQETVQLTLTAAPDAPRETFRLRVVGTVTVAEKPVERVAEPMEAPVEGQRQRATLFQLAGVGEPGPFTVAVEPRQATLSPDGTATLTVKVARRPDAEAGKGEIALELSNAPEGVEVKAPAIPADKSEGTIELKATEKAKPGTVNLVLRGRVNKVAGVAPAVMLTVAPKPAEGAK